MTLESVNEMYMAGSGTHGLGLGRVGPSIYESRARSVPKWIEVDRSGSRHRSVPKWHRLGTLLAQFGTLLNEVFHEGEGAK
jgi:hypothetical protein